MSLLKTNVAKKDKELQHLRSTLSQYSARNINKKLKRREDKINSLQAELKNAGGVNNIKHEELFKLIAEQEQLSDKYKKCMKDLRGKAETTEIKMLL